MTEEGIRPMKNSADAPYRVDSNEAQIQLALLAYFEEHGENTDEEVSPPTHNEILKEWLNSKLAKKYRKYCGTHPNKMMRHTETSDILAEIRSISLP